jgi:hypothetical protein
MLIEWWPNVCKTIGLGCNSTKWGSIIRGIGIATAWRSNATNCMFELVQYMVHCMLITKEWSTLIY